MTLRRKIRLIVSAVWACAALGGVYSVYLSRSAPAWYQHTQLNAGQQIAAANQSDQTVADCASFANDLAAALRRHLVSGEALPVEAKTVTLSQDEINAFIAKWEPTFFPPGAQEPGSISGACVDLVPGRIILAASAHQDGLLGTTVLSAEFGLSLDDQEQLEPRLIEIYAGRLPLPGPLTAPLHRKVEARLGETIGYHNMMKHTWPDGLSNPDAAAVVWESLLLAAMNDQNVDSILLLPCDLGGLDRSVPVRLTDLEIGAGTITFTLRPLTSQEMNDPR